MYGPSAGSSYSKCSLAFSSFLRSRLIPLFAFTTSARISKYFAFQRFAWVRHASGRSRSVFMFKASSTNLSAHPLPSSFNDFHGDPLTTLLIVFSCSPKYGHALSSNHLSIEMFSELSLFLGNQRTPTFHTTCRMAHFRIKKMEFRQTKHGHTANESNHERYLQLLYSRYTY